METHTYEPTINLPLAAETIINLFDDPPNLTFTLSAARQYQAALNEQIARAEG